MGEGDYHILIKEMPEAERPRERLMYHGAEALSTVELIGVGRRLSTANAGDPWVLVGVAAFYLVITIPAGLLASALERRVAFAR